MSDTKANTVSVRILEDTLDSIAEEQLRLKRKHRKKLSIAELIQQAWDAYMDVGTGGTVDTSPQMGRVSQGAKVVLAENFPREDTRSSVAGWTEILAVILNSGHTVAIDAITRNLYAFLVLIRSNSEACVGHADGVFTLPTPEEMLPDIARILNEALALAERDGIIEQKPEPAIR